MCEKLKTYFKEHKSCVCWATAIIIVLIIISVFSHFREERYNHFSRDGRGNYEMKFDKDSSGFERWMNQRNYRDNFRNNNETQNQVNRGNMMNAQSGANLGPNQMMQVQQQVNANTGTVAPKTNTGASTVK